MERFMARRGFLAVGNRNQRRVSNPWDGRFCDDSGHIPARKTSQFLESPLQTLKQPFPNPTRRHSAVANQGKDLAVVMTRLGRVEPWIESGETASRRWAESGECGAVALRALQPTPDPR